jgi:hypothetical protein
MELKEFVRNTLIPIVTSVEEATKKLKTKDEKRYFLVSGYGEKAYINFDVAVTTVSEKSGKARGEAKIYVVEGGLEGKISHSTENITKVQFKVYVN